MAPGQFAQTLLSEYSEPAVGLTGEPGGWLDEYKHRLMPER